MAVPKFLEGLACEDVHVGVGKLLSHYLGVRRLLDEPAGERRGVGDALSHARGACSVRGPHDAHDPKRDTLVEPLPHVALVVGHVCPRTLRLVFLIEGTRGYHLEGHAHGVVVGERPGVIGHLHLLAVQHLLCHLAHDVGVIEPQAIEGVVTDAPILVECEHRLVSRLGPAAPDHAQLTFEQPAVIHELTEGRVRGAAREGRAHGPTGHLPARLGGIEPHDALGAVALEDLWGDAIAILDVGRVSTDV